MTLNFDTFTRGPSTVGQTTDSSTSPWVFPRCGHVHGFNSQLVIQQRCPLCREESPYTELKPESQEIMHIFCKEKPTHVFNPCGHVIDYSGALFWGSLKLPTVYDSVYERPNCTACPFCRISLSKEKPFSKLIFQAEMDNEEDGNSLTPTVDLTPFVQSWLDNRKKQLNQHSNSNNNNNEVDTNPQNLYISDSTHNGEENATQANVSFQSDTQMVVPQKYDMNFG